MLNVSDKVRPNNPDAFRRDGRQLIVRQRLSPSQKRKKPTPLETFAMIPRALTQNPAQYGLDVFVFALLAGLLRGATEARRDRLDKLALQAGNRALIRHQRKHGKDYNERAQQARRRGYWKRMNRLKRETPLPEVLAFDMNPSGLLKHSGLYVNTANIRKLHATIPRLLLPVIEGLPPVVRSYRSFLEHDRVRFYVSGHWLTPPTVKVPIPLPTKSIQALHLLLFLRSIGEPGHYDGAKGGSISLAKLCDWIGMKPCIPSQQALRLERALHAVHTCIWQNTTKHSSRRNDIPAAYGMAIKDGRVRFAQIQRGLDLD